MRKQARQLDEDQKKISEQLDAGNQGRRPSLRDSDERKEVRQGLEQQETRLDQLLERMKRTVQEAEETEPLLAKGLYDTVRKADEQKIPDALKISQAARSTPASPTTPPRRPGPPARASTSCGKASSGRPRSVLGDETAALRKAQGELEDLGDQVDREIAQKTGPGTEGAGG